jgi:formylglycine-generating enzyme required for sulfatase activity
VLVKAGTFMMGSPETEIGRDNDELQHQVTLTEDFYISKYKITQAQYESVMGNNPSYFTSARDADYGEGSNKPVETVTWNNAVGFATRVGGRLPTEAEWEFAARGGNKSEGYIYSGSDNLDEVGWYLDNIPSQTRGSAGYGTQEVGQLLPNELGIYDMSGNVYEWCSDWYGNYSGASQTNPTGATTGAYRVSRGGYWGDDARYCRAAFRDYFSSGGNIDLGFRVVFPLN